MSYELHETEWARDAVMRRDMGKSPFETLSRVARYYLDSGFSKIEVRKMLDVFALQCDPDFSTVLNSDMLDNALKRAIKRPAVNIDTIKITKSEMKDIIDLEQRQAQRLAFTLLCLAKYFDAINPNNNHWVSAKDSEIMKMANISTSIKRQSSMYNFLHGLSLIQFSKQVDNLSTRVMFIEENDKTVLEVDDLRNLGYQYLKYRGSDEYYVCECCGITERGKIVTPRGRPRKYCPDCAAKLKMRKDVNRVMSYGLHSQ